MAIKPLRAITVPVSDGTANTRTDILTQTPHTSQTAHYLKPIITAAIQTQLEEVLGVILLIQKSKGNRVVYDSVQVSHLS